MEFPRTVSFMSKTEGRDKLAKVVQALSRVIAWHLHRRKQTPEIIDFIARMDAIDRTTTDARRVFRWFKGIIQTHKMSELIKNWEKEPVIRQALQLVMIVAYFMYFFYDNLLYLSRTLCPSWDAKNLGRLAKVWWFWGALPAFVQDVLVLLNYYYPAVFSSVAGRDAQTKFKVHRLLGTTGSGSTAVVNASAEDLDEMDFELGNSERSSSGFLDVPRARMGQGGLPRRPSFPFLHIRHDGDVARMWTQAIKDFADFSIALQFVADWWQLPTWWNHYLSLLSATLSTKLLWDKCGEDKYKKK